MSFSRDVRNQLAQLPVEKICCRQSQLLAFTIVGATETISIDGVPALVFHVDNAAIARQLFRLGKAIYGASPSVSTRLEGAQHRHAVFRVAIPVSPSGMAPASLTIDQLQDAISKKVCCRRSFLRGAFMGCGSLVSPTKAYHLEFNAAEGAAAWIQELLEHDAVHAKLYQRTAASDVFTVYVKDSGEIANFLTLIGAHHALMQYEEVRIGKDLVNNVQRVVNCETANLNRTLASAERQIGEIMWLDAEGWLDDMPSDWRAVAHARVEMPYASLSELGSSLEPPLSKSAVNHRLRLLHQTYEERRPSAMQGEDLGL
ncbi:MAG: DNA-binding protein WhiA [Cyanobacteria bacterium RYN_339]|nr:DNA-binding protein WhiA [Cyanobacteria bacterium RYN_339]